MSKWRDDFEQRFDGKTIGEVKQISQQILADQGLSKILAKQNEKMRSEKIQKEIMEMMKR